MARAIEDELRTIDGLETAGARSKRGKLSSLEVTFTRARIDLDKANFPFMVALLAGALGNLVALIVASMDADMPLGLCSQIGLVFLSVGYFVLVLVVLEVFARLHLSAIQKELKAIREARS